MMPERDLAGTSRWLRWRGWMQHHLTTRMRMTLAYGALASVVAVAALVAINLVMRWVPSYSFAKTKPLTATSDFRRGESVARTESDSRFLPTEPAKTVDVTSPESLFDTLWTVSIIAMIALVAITMLATWIIAGRLLRPLTRLNDAANLAAEGHLHHRLDIAGPKDQVTMLATTFNRMLGRLDRQFESHRRFAANASHELRTPLATTKAILQTAHDEDLESPGQARRLIERLAITNQRSIDLVDALLDLADSENVVLNPEHADLAAIIKDASAEVEPLARERQVRMEPDLNSAGCYADPALVRIIATNLLTNAVRHNHSPGRVIVSTGIDDSEAILTITNTGSVFTTEQVEEFLASFSRARLGADGHGLGLAITRNLVEANDGQVSLCPREGGGLVAQVRLPRGPSAGSTSQRPEGYRCASGADPLLNRPAYNELAPPANEWECREPRW